MFCCYSTTILSNCRKRKERRITRVEQNRRARRKDLLKAEAEVKKLESLSKELDRYSSLCPWTSSALGTLGSFNLEILHISLPDIVKEIAKEDKEKELRHLRRVVAKQEKLKAGPPRLGKHKWVSNPLSTAHFYWIEIVLHVILFYFFLIFFAFSRAFRFKPAPLQVLLTEEISGSLRKLKVTTHFLLVW